MITHVLQDIGVLVTRPAAQAESLCQSIEDAGGHAIRFPAIEIADIQNIQPLNDQIHRLHEFDLAIFVSVNAAVKGAAFVSSIRTWPVQCQVAAIGKRTAAALEHAGIAVNVIPQGRFDSESLLALAELQDMSGKRVIIFRGEGGRELLGNSLRERGAQVEYAETYRRVMPDEKPDEVLRYWESGRINITIVTSGEILVNLITLIGESGKHLLFHTPLVVISERIAQQARDMGFMSTIMVSREMSDAAIMESLYQWVAQGKQSNG